MADKLTKYDVVLVCDAVQWSDFNVFLIAAGYDTQNRRITFNSLEDRIRDIGSEGKDTPPRGERIIRLTTDPCAYAEIYMYAVANAMPESNLIKDNPPFPLTLKVFAEGELLEESHYDVNRLGGLTIVGHRVGDHQRD